MLFVDSDVFLEEDLGSWIVNHARTDQFYTVRDRRQSDLCGTVICGKAEFDRIGGYDEVFRGWGEEDNDLYERFSTSGLTSNFLPDHALRSIQHGDELRMLGKQDPSGYTNRRQAIVLGRMYRIIKMDLQRLLLRQLSFGERKKIFDEIQNKNHRALSDGQSGFRLVLTVPPEPARNRRVNCKRTLVYTGVATI